MEATAATLWNGNESCLRPLLRLTYANSIATPSLAISATRADVCASFMQPRCQSLSVSIIYDSMMPRHVWIAFCCLFTAVQAQFAFPDGASQQVGLHVDGSDRVFVAAGNRLFRLGSDFALEESVTLASEVVGTALSADESAIVVCTGDNTCGVYNTSDLAGGASDTRPISKGETASSLALFASSNESFYLGTATTGGQQVFELRHYGYGSSVKRVRT